jgi:hypothetical protein
MALYAKSKAYIDELQALSTAIEGPCNAKANEIRLANIVLADLQKQNFN